MTLIENLSRWASRLDLDDVPERVVRFAASQVLSQLAAARAGAQHPLGRAVVRGFGPPWQQDPAQSAFVLAGLTSWLHFDDTAYAGHLSNSTVTVPLAYAHGLGLDGRQLLTAVIAANECAARVTAAATLGPFRGQNAAHTHVAGAVSGRLRASDAPLDEWVNAFGIAFAMPPRPFLRAFLGSDAKVLSAAVPVRAGLDACDAARAGLVGPRDILEHPDGFLAAFSSVPLPEAVDLDLGRRWHTETLSFKLHPGGPGLDAAVDCARELRAAIGPVQAADIADVVVTTSMYTLVVDQKAAEFVDAQRSPVSALVFCTPYAVATALLTGNLTAADFALPAVADPARWQLAARVRLEHDSAMTRESLLSAAPFGEALRQAGPRAAKWLEEVGGDWLVELVGTPAEPAPTFETATKATPARVEVRLANGDVHGRELSIPRGAIGPELRAGHAALVREKYLATGGPVDVADIASELADASARDVRTMLERSLDGCALPAGALSRTSTACRS
jgi:2-methylcitrate dehydratase PrpD